MPIDRTAEQERAAIVAWLETSALFGSPKQLSSRWPAWRSFLWAMLHPRKFREEHGRFFALLNAAKSIERGDHHSGETNNG